METNWIKKNGFPFISNEFCIFTLHSRNIIAPFVTDVL